jgi:NAD(P)H-hydrate epimerase
MISFKEVRVLDINAQYLGVPTKKLMENAGKHVASVVKKNFDLKGKKIGVFCGTGNNGGDGFVAARYLSKSCEVKVITLKPSNQIKTKLAQENFAKLKGAVEVVSWNKGISDDCDMIIDAIFGIGIKGEIKEPYKSAIKEINASGKPIISVDVPSGLGADTSVKPMITVTFHDIKEGMNENTSGKIVKVDIGIPKDAERFVGPGEFVYYPKPLEDSHKGENGRLLIVGGGPYTGAPALAGMAAYRMGVDLVRIAVPEAIHSIIAAYSPNFIVHPLGGNRLTEQHVSTIMELLDEVDALLIGPGLGNDNATKIAVQTIIKKCKKPIVIDADGISAVADDLSVLEGHAGVITPHANEFKRLSGKAADKDTIKDLAGRTGFTILLKGKEDVISDGKRTKKNRTGNEGMTVGGTGDVLSGIVSALLAKGISSFNAARIAAFTNGTAGDLAFKEKGYSMLATDVIEKIPMVLKEFL